MTLALTLLGAAAVLVGGGLAVLGRRSRRSGAEGTPEGAVPGVPGEARTPLGQNTWTFGGGGGS